MVRYAHHMADGRGDPLACPRCAKMAMVRPMIPLMRQDRLHNLKNRMVTLPAGGSSYSYMATEWICASCKITIRTAGTVRTEWIEAEDAKP